MPEVIAIREFRFSDGTVLNVAICKPFALDNGHYQCDCECSGREGLSVPPARGVDSLQALIIAIELLRKALRPSRKELTWSGGLSGTGIPIIPLGAYILGDEFGDEIERMLESQFEKRHLDYLAGKKKPEVS